MRTSAKDPCGTTDAGKVGAQSPAAKARAAEELRKSRAVCASCSQATASQISTKQTTPLNLRAGSIAPAGTAALGTLTFESCLGPPAKELVHLATKP